MLDIPLENWIGHNHRFQDAPLSIQNEADRVFKLPQEVQMKFLPEKRLSIRELLDFAIILLSQSKTAVEMDVQTFYSHENPTDAVDYQEMERLHFPPPNMLKEIIQTKNQAGLKTPEHKLVHMTQNYHGYILFVYTWLVMIMLLVSELRPCSSTIYVIGVSW
ncbi:hypothetical protein K439DRAFT_1621920 [Ramaria rubella]|nr:hypothetical protein K439DRAFT_1621920 [Ramaria rubella]